MRRATALVIALAAVAVAPVAPAETPVSLWRVYENRVSGHAVRYPPHWHAVTRRDGATIVTSFPLRNPGRAPGEVQLPAETGAYLFLFDYGRPVRVSGERAGVPRALGAASMHACGFGFGHSLHFRLGGHQFHGFVRFGPRPLATTKARVLRVLASLRLTPRAQQVSNVHSTRIIGRTTRGRAIRVWRVGNPRSARKILVIGCIHGTECAGMNVTQRLVNLTHPIAADLWVIQNLNPDGLALGVRQNGRGVDLNRNFGSEWKPIGRRWDAQYSGPHPFSEPETRAARDLIERVRPQVTLWFHQPQGIVRAWGPSVAIARRYARFAREPYRSLRWPNGTAPNWQNHRFAGRAAFVVELRPGPVGVTEADRHASAILRLAG
jgi:protein MpaA